MDHHDLVSYSLVSDISPSRFSSRSMTLIVQVNHQIARLGLSTDHIENPPGPVHYVESLVGHDFEYCEILGRTSTRRRSALVHELRRRGLSE